MDNFKLYSMMHSYLVWILKEAIGDNLKFLYQNFSGNTEKATRNLSRLWIGKKGEYPKYETGVLNV